MKNRILIVDDEEEILKSFSLCLEDAGYEVLEASTGKQALQVARENLPDVVLLDVILPDIGGLDVCKQIKADPALQDVFVILCSGHAVGSARTVEGLETGADEYLNKPVSREELLARVRTVIRLRNTVSALRTSEKHYRGLIDILPDAVCLIDAKGKILTANARALEMFRYSSADELMAGTIFDLAQREHHERLQSDITGALQAGSVRNLNYTLIRQGGQTFPAELSAAALPGHADMPLGLVTVLRDLTERREAERALQTSDERFRQMAVHIREVFWMTNAARSEMIYVSPAYEEIWGQTCASLYAAPEQWTEAVHPEDRERVVHAIQTRQAEGLYDELYRIIRPDGSLRWIQDRAFPIRDGAGQVYRIAGIAEDITKRKLASDALHESEARRGAIMQSALDAIMTIDHDGRITGCNPASEKIFGAGSRRIIGKDITSSVIARSWREWFRIGLKDSFQGEDGPHLNTRTEMAALRADGSEFPVECTLTRIELEGLPMFTAFIRDITSRKRTEEKIRLLAYAVQSANEFICVTDEKNRFTFVNQAFLRAYGYKEKEIVGKQPDMLYSRKNAPGLCGDVFRQTLNGGWSGELINRKKDGTEFPVSLSTSQIRNTEGAILGLIGVASDITRRRLAEEELRDVPRRIIAAQEAERLRVARDLHDGVNQLIASAKMRIGKVEEHVGPSNPAAREILGRCGALLVQALEENRRIARDLRPTDLDELGLAAACRNLCKNLQSRTDLAVKLQIVTLPETLAGDVELHLFRILQEALSNVEKHARAKNVRVRLTGRNGEITLKIQDDGRGVPDPAHSRRKKKRTGNGLTNMRERAAFLGGSFGLDGEANKGTLIHVRIPLSDGK